MLSLWVKFFRFSTEHSCSIATTRKRQGEYLFPSEQVVSLEEKFGRHYSPGLGC